MPTSSRRLSVVLPLAPLLAVAGGGTASASPTPAARAAAALGEQVGAGAAALRVALLLGTALVAGIALVGALRQAAGRRGLTTTTWVAAGVVAVAAEVVHLTGDVSVLGTVLQVVAALAAAALVGTRWSALPGALLLVLLAVQLGSTHTGLSFALDAAYAVGATLLLGAAAHAATSASPPATVRESATGGPRALRARPASRAPETRGSGASAAAGSDGGDESEPPTVSLTAVSGAGGPSEASATKPRAGRGLLVALAVVGGLLAVVAGVAQLLVSGPETGFDLLHTGYGLASLAAVVLPLLGVAAAIMAARKESTRHESTFRALGVAGTTLSAPKPRSSHAESTKRAHGEVLRIAGALGAAGVVAAGLLAALPPPGPAAVPGEPLLRAANVGGQSLAVLVAPMRPGPNLVHVSGTYPRAGEIPAPAVPTSHHQPSPTAAATVAVGDAPPVPITARDGAGGGWAVVDLPAGTGALTLAVGSGSTTVPVDTGTQQPAASGGLTGDDGPECASALLGDLAGQRSGTPAPAAGACPADALSDADAAALTATVRGIGERGVTRIRLVSDGSARSRAAADVVRRAAPDAQFVDRVDKDAALVVVSGWAAARTTLDEAAARALETPTHLGGTYLAPWLLTPGVVTATSSSVLPLTFDPQDTLARRYAGAVATLFPGEPPATLGFLAWVRHEGVPLADRPTLYGAAPVDVPMTSTGRHHEGDPNPAAWFPGGTVVPVSAPLQ